MRVKTVRWVSLLLLFCVACERGRDVSGETKAAGPDANTHTNVQVFQVRGVVVSVHPARKEIEIKHETIPGFMPGMTMPFDVKDTKEFRGVKPGEAITFRLSVADTEAWIDQIRPAAPLPATNGPPPGASIRPVRDVQPLSIGDPLPDYTLTNQFGEAFHTATFEGQALAITFLFTRCPYPTFCPRMARNFEETQQKLAAAVDTPANWRLLTVSFDPEFDKPAVLKAYAEARGYDPRHWTFATGSLIDVTALGEQFGLTFWHDPNGSISHNLRTVVIDTAGRVRKIFEGNEWTSDDLSAELKQALR